MAQKIVTKRVSDISGAEPAKNVKFGIDGTNYEIDLTSDEAAALRSGIVAECVAHGRKVGGARRPGRTPASNSATSGVPNTAKSLEIRAWARTHGFPNTKDRGRLPNDALAEYNKAHGTSYTNN